MPSRGLGYRTERGKETVEFWKSQILEARRQWDIRDGVREAIRDVISEMRFPALMYKDGGAALSDLRTDAGARARYPHIDQIDLNLPLRYQQRLVSNIGDEVPEVIWGRNWTSPWEGHAHKFDVLTQRQMSRAGAPENNADGAKDVCSDGITTFWIMPTYEVTGDDLYRATESVDLVIDRILADPEAYQPAEGDDHELMGEVLEGRAMDWQTDQRDPSGVVSNALSLAASKHYAKAAKDKKATWRWRSQRLELEHTRLPYGTHALMDPSTSMFREARWVARAIRRPVVDARQNPAYHPQIRKKLQQDSFDIVTGTSREAYPNRWTNATDNKDGEWLGMCTVWEIHDRKYHEIIYLNFGIEQFLNAGKKSGVSRMDHPFVTPEGREMIPRVGPYPGFFPCFFFAPSEPKRDDEQKKFGQPLLQPGMKLVYGIVKLLSHYVQTVKRSSSAIYEAHPKLTDSARRAIRLGKDGTIFTRPPDVPPGESLMQVEWKAPSEQLFRQVHELISQWCMIQSFPMAELTTQPQADTATQEQIGLAAGDAWMSEIVRKFEVSYSVQCHIMAHLSVQFQTKSDWAELIGLEDANVLFDLIREARFPPDLPTVRLASKRRGQGAVRVSQLMDLHERGSADIDPILGLPKWDLSPLLQEAARVLEAGKLQRYTPQKEQIEMLAEARIRVAQAQQLEQAGQSGGGPAARPSGNGQDPSARPALGGSPGGSASNARSSSSARRSRRGGRRGRGGGAATESSTMSSAQDSGGVA